MPKNTHFETWQRKLEHEDRCPVCWCSLEFRSRSNYCSNRCVAIAKGYREKCRRYAAKLQAVGFTAFFHDGFYPEIRLPHYMGAFYPGQAQSFFPFQPHAISLKSVSGGEFWDGVKRHLGETVTDAIVKFKPSEYRCYSDACVGFHEILKDLMFLGKGTYICEGCGGKYFDGYLVRTGNYQICCDLQQLKFPF